MKNIIKKQSGITLIALIVTIIILIILAGVTINLTLGENGIIARAKQAKEKQEISAILEKLEMEKANVKLNGKTINLENYLEQIISVKIIEDSDIEETGEENSRFIKVDGYVFLITDEENDNVRIEYEGKVGENLPKIKNIGINSTTSSITVKVKAISVNNGDYKYYIKDIASGEEYKLIETSKSSECTFKQLKENKEYKVKVEITNKNGTTEKETEIIKTVNITNLTKEDVEFIYNPDNIWTNGTVNVTVKSKIEIPEGQKIQTSIDEKKWDDTTIQTLKENGKVYVRVTDGTNEGTIIQGEVNKIDKTDPITNTELLCKELTTKGFTLSIGVVDTESGIGKIVWYYKKSTDIDYITEEEIYTELNESTSGITEETTKTKKYENLTSGTYNAYIEVYDVAGNKTTSNIIDITVPTAEILNFSANQKSVKADNSDSGTYSSQSKTITKTNTIGATSMTVNASKSDSWTAAGQASRYNAYVKVTIDGVDMGTLSNGSKTFDITNKSDIQFFLYAQGGNGYWSNISINVTFN